jgi:hypothetical protein
LIIQIKMKFIINPLTEESVLLTSPEGKQILLEYVKCFQEGGVKKKPSGLHTNRKKKWAKKSIKSSAFTTSAIRLKFRDDKEYLINHRNNLNKQIIRSIKHSICPSGMIVTYNIQGTFIKSGLFDGTLKYIQDTPSIFCVQEIGGLTKNQTDFIKMIKGGYNFRDKTIRRAQIKYAENAEEEVKEEPGSGFFGNSKLIRSDSKGAIFQQGNWTCIQYYWEGRNGGPKDTAILYNNKFYKHKNILSISFIGAETQFRPIGGVLLYSKNLRREIAVFTIHMPSLGGGVIPDIYNSIIAYLNKYKGIDIFLVGDFNLDSDTVEIHDENERNRKHFLTTLLKETGSILYESSEATHQSGRRLDYIIHRPVIVDAGLPTVQLHTLLSYNVASSDHSSLGLCLEDIFPEEDDSEVDGEEGDGEDDSEDDSEDDGEDGFGDDGEVDFKEIAGAGAVE